jgi:hypothetical protein
MSIFKPSTWGITRAYRDVENYFDWIKTIKKEEVDYQSKYTKWKLQHNKFFTVYFMMDIDENESQLPEQIKRLRMIESLAPLHRYLDEELGFAGNITPEFNQFYDDQNRPTLTYLIAYRFCFNVLSLKWVIKSAVILTGLIVLLLNLSPIIKWITNLI